MLRWRIDADKRIQVSDFFSFRSVDVEPCPALWFRFVILSVIFLFLCSFSPFPIASHFRHKWFVDGENTFWFSYFPIHFMTCFRRIFQVQLNTGFICARWWHYKHQGRRARCKVVDIFLLILFSVRIRHFLSNLLRIESKIWSGSYGLFSAFHLRFRVVNSVHCPVELATHQNHLYTFVPC